MTGLSGSPLALGQVLGSWSQHRRGQNTYCNPLMNPVAKLDPEFPCDTFEHRQKAACGGTLE